MTLIIDPDALARAGRASVEEARALRDAIAAVDFGNTLVSDDAARERLSDRVRQLSRRLRANGTTLETLAQEYREVDGMVALSFLAAYTKPWR